MSISKQHNQASLRDSAKVAFVQKRSERMRLPLITPYLPISNRFNAEKMVGQTYSDDVKREHLENNASRAQQTA